MSDLQAVITWSEDGDQILTSMAEQGIQLTSTEPLSLDRIRLARQTLTAAFSAVFDEKFPGAIDADPDMAFSEAKRNLTAYVGWKYGQAEFTKILDED